ncbi:unnamed protein product [Rotaria sp. Silwood2]|nr:unnamed protein product [Rotaria sp. Silwood2]CAF4090475.1 unnamed protein product [Rotaria sp. Silwood2]
MSNKGNKNQEFLATCMWQRNLSQARNINVDLNNVLDNSFNLLLDLLNNFKITNDTDPTGLLLSLFACVGHLCVDSTVNITNDSTNLNIFLLLIGPSGSGKSKIIAPIKKAMLNTIKSLGITNEKAGILDEFTTASLTAKLAKSNVIIITDEAEKPLLSMGFYSPLSEASAAERISGCKFFGTIPTTKDTMSYHLEITSHLSFVGATTGRLWHRLINYYAQGHQSDGFSERFIHYAMPKKNDVTANTSQSLDYDEGDDETNDNDDNISEEDYEFEKMSHIRRWSPSLSQILIVRQYQELSQLEKKDDINFGSRMGKSAEIICKLAAISQMIKISIEILKELQEQNQIQYDNTNFMFIRNVAQILETKYSSINNTLEIEASSCRLAGVLFCNLLLKMLFALYDVEPVLASEKKTIIESMSLHSTTKQIHQIVFNMPQLFFKKRDLTGPMGLLRHHATDMVNIVIDELIEYELIRQGRSISNETNTEQNTSDTLSNHSKLATENTNTINISRIFSNNNITNSQKLNNFVSTNTNDFPISPITSILSASDVTTTPIHQVPSTTKNHQPAIAQTLNEPIASTTTKTTNSISAKANNLGNDSTSHNSNGKSYSERKRVSRT